MDIILEKIKNFADNAHGDQMRRYTNQRYIVHPEAVMNICSEYTQSLPVLAAALLHDVLEDISTTEEEVSRFLSTVMSPADTDRTVALVQELTDKFTKENFPGWNRKLRRCKEGERLSTASAEAQTIKYADLIDNCIDISNNDLDFAPVFLRESKDLLQKIDKGNPSLYKRAMNVVEECIEKVRVKLKDGCN